MTDVPHTMSAIRLLAYGPKPKLELKQVATPTPGPGEVLVRVEAAPMHLDDVVFCRGQHGFSRALPTTPGTEGSGTVVQVGGGLVARFLLGRRVAFAPAESSPGTWAAYAVCDATRCLPLWEDIDDETASMLLVDPVSALSLLDDARARGHTAIVQTDPTGPIGRMILKLGRAWGFPVVHVAEDAEEAAATRALGGEQVIDAQSPESPGQLRRATRSFRATCLLDGHGGNRTGRLLAAMPDGSEAVLYGLEPGAQVEVDLAQFVWHGKTVRGFAFADRARETGTRSLLAQLPRLHKWSADVFRQKVAARIRLDELPAVVDGYRRSAGGRRTVVLPQLPAPES